MSENIKKIAARIIISTIIGAGGVIAVSTTATAESTTTVSTPTPSPSPPPDPSNAEFNTPWG